MIGELLDSENAVIKLNRLNYSAKSYNFKKTFTFEAAT